MTSFDHKVCRPERTYELRLEDSNGSRIVVSSDDYHNVKKVALTLVGKIGRKTLVITTSDGYEICRWM